MVNEERIKLMVKLAAYEEKEGKNDFKVSSYYKKDYVSFNILCTIIWTTIGYMILIALLGLAFMEKLLEHITLKMGILLFGGVGFGYILIVVIYGIMANRFYQNKHDQARKRVKRYSHDLLVLNRLYEKENV